MDSRRYKRLSELFLQARRLPPGDRVSFIDKECADDSQLRAQLEALLAHDEDGSNVLGTDILVSQLRADLAGTETHPEHIGPYKITRVLGEGGMGIVYLAEQERPVRRQVAIKLIKWGMDTKQVVARFESERQALALMDHPAIAKVFDAGATEDGRPYFVMEYIQGEPITKHCDRHQLTTHQRLELFVQICGGVQHAHQRAIIHRDLKPSNVLAPIQDGKVSPKIIDFGVAKATAQRLTEKTLFTELGVMIGTPEYMSPEQAELAGQDVDTRTDVYSLGVMLYELLVGALPFDPKELRQAGFDEIRRRIREEEPSKPSARLSTLGDKSAESAESRKTDLPTLRRQLRGDLDWITMRALEKDRARRYGSPGELAADIVRHLKNEPVMAGPPGAAYRSAKFVRRHRVGVTVAALLAVTGVLGITGTTIGLLRSMRAERLARDEAHRANSEAQTARQVSDFLVGLFEGASPQARGEDITVREILDRGAEKLERELGGQAIVRARLLSTLGRTYTSLGLYDTAAPLLEEALSVQLDQLGERHLDTADTLVNLGRVHDLLGNTEKELELLKRGLAVREQLLGPDHLDVAEPLWMMAGESPGEDLELRQRALAILEKNLGREHPMTYPIRSDLALSFQMRGQREQARAMHELNIAIAEANGSENVGVILSLLNLAGDLGADEDPARAMELAERAVAISQRIYKDEHPYWSAAPLMFLGNLHRDAGNLDKARPLLERAVALAGPKIRPRVVRSLSQLHEDAGEPEKARRLYESELAAFEEQHGPEHSLLVTILHDLSRHHRDYGKVSDAVPLLQRAGKIALAELGETDEYTVHYVIDLAECYVDLGLYGNAEPLLLKTLATLTRELGESDPQSLEVLYGLASLAAAQGQRGKSLDFLRRAVDQGWAENRVFEDGAFDPLRGDSEFEAIVAEVKKRIDEE